MVIKLIHIVKVDDYGLTAFFSDGTTARFVVEELIGLRPYREASSQMDRILLRLPIKTENKQ